MTQAPETLESKELKARKQAIFDNLRALQRTEKRNLSTNFMLIGESKTGKTFTLLTARKPIYHISFDSDNTDCVYNWHKAHPELIELDNRCEVEDPLYPKVYDNYCVILNELIDSGLIHDIGTLYIDSATFLGDSILRKIVHTQKRTMSFHNLDKGKKVRQADYGYLLTTIRDEMNKLTTTPCDVVLTAHLNHDYDEGGSRIASFPMLSGQSKVRVPAVFSENYFMINKRSSEGLQRFFLTQPKGLLEAGSRLSQGGLIDTEEPFRVEMNKDSTEVVDSYGLKDLLKKAGRRWEDNPPFPV